MKNNLLKYALTVMVLFIAAATCPAQEEGPPMVGGYKEVPKTDKTVIIAARFAVLSNGTKTLRSNSWQSNAPPDKLCRVQITNCASPSRAEINRRKRRRWFIRIYKTSFP